MEKGRDSAGKKMSQADQNNISSVEEMVKLGPIHSKPINLWI